MITNTKNWLASYYEIGEDKIELYFKDEDVTGFLIVWTIFEQKLFKGFFKWHELKKYIGPEFHASISGLEKEFTHFFDIYQDKIRFKNLIHGENEKEEIKNILNLKDTINDEDKLRLVLFVVYRYRNNIFHGNKSVSSWTRYKPEIGYCVNIMKALLDGQK